MAEMDQAWNKAIIKAIKSSPFSTSINLDSSIKSNGLLPSPDVLSVLPKTLESLSLANCRLSSLRNFPSLPSLRYLNLSDNRISNSLDALVIAELKGLKILDLANNRIATVAEVAVLKGLEGIESLDLYECPVTRVPGYREKVFEAVPSLKFLDKVDKEGNERPDSDEEEEDEDEEDEIEGEGADEEEEGIDDEEYEEANVEVVDGEEEEYDDDDDEDGDEVEVNFNCKFGKCWFNNFWFTQAIQLMPYNCRGHSPSERGL
jgi:acidic leucine-rich nuclear phosphoprotein 32 family member B